MGQEKPKGVTVTGPISIELATELEGFELANYINSIIQKALEARGIKVLNANLDVFDVWDPESE